MISIASSSCVPVIPGLFAVSEKPPGVFTVCFGYGVSCGLGGVCSCVLDGRQNGCNGVLAGGVLCRSPVEHAGAVLFHRMRPGVGRLQTDNAVLFWSDEHAGALCDVQPEQYGLVSKIQSAGAVRLSARIAVRGCRYGGGCGSAGCQKETGKAVEPPCPRYPGMKKPQRQQALRLHVLLCSQCNLRLQVVIFLHGILWNRIP